MTFLKMISNCSKISKIFIRFCLSFPWNLSSTLSGNGNPEPTNWKSWIPAGVYPDEDRGRNDTLRKTDPIEPVLNQMPHLLNVNKPGSSGFSVGNLPFFLFPLTTSTPFVLSLGFDRLTMIGIFPNVLSEVEGQAQDERSESRQRKQEER